MTFVMFMTTLIVTLAILVVWNHNILVALTFFLVFGLIDMSFLTAALSKFTHGGWFPIALSGAQSLALLRGSPCIVAKITITRSAVS